MWILASDVVCQILYCGLLPGPLAAKNNFIFISITMQTTKIENLRLRQFLRPFITYMRYISELPPRRSITLHAWVSLFTGPCPHRSIGPSGRSHKA